MRKKKDPHIKKEIRIACKGAGILSYKKLVPFQGKLKKLSAENYGKLRKEILELGFSEPINIWRHDSKAYVCNGHQRLRTIKKMVEKEGFTCPLLPVNFVEAKNIKQAKLKVLALTSQYGEITESGLTEFLVAADIDTIILKDSFRFPELDQNSALFKNAEEDSEKDNVVPEVSKKPIAKRGNIWKLGNHRLVCGDSTKEDDVKKLMGDKKADMLFTDPPYGVSYADKNKYLNKIDGGDRIQTPIQRDHDTPEKMFDLWKRAFAICSKILADISSYYICGPQGGELFLLMCALRDSGLPLHHMLIWLKNNHVLGRCDYNYKHEPILYGWITRHKFYKKGESIFSTWNYNKPTKSELHPIMKPVAIVENAILNSTVTGMCVVDLFGGSGSTMIACEKTGRRCYMMEIDKHYCDVIIKRWEDYTGRKSRLIRPGGRKARKRAKKPNGK